MTDCVDLVGQRRPYRCRLLAEADVLPRAFAGLSFSACRFSLALTLVGELGTDLA